MTMSARTRGWVVRMLTFTSGILWFLQTYVEYNGSTLSNPDKKILSGVVFLSLIIATVAKQFLSSLIENRAIKRTLIVGIAALVIGSLDFAKIWEFDPAWAGTIRFVFASILTYLNGRSKSLFPANNFSNINSIQMNKGVGLGTEHLYLAIALGLRFGKQAIVSGADGWQPKDAIDFFDEALDIPGVVSNGAVIKAEALDFTSDEKDALVSRAKAEFQLDDATAEAKVEASLDWTLSTLALYNTWRG